MLSKTQLIYRKTSLMARPLHMGSAASKLPPAQSYISPKQKPWLCKLFILWQKRKESMRWFILFALILSFKNHTIVLLEIYISCEKKCNLSKHRSTGGGAVGGGCSYEASPWEVMQNERFIMRNSTMSLLHFNVVRVECTLQYINFSSKDLSENWL